MCPHAEFTCCSSQFDDADSYSETLSPYMSGMRKDRFGNTITAATADAIEAFDIYGDDWLGYGTRVAKIFTAADAAPGSAYLNAHAAATHMGLEAASGFRAAEPYLARARNHAAQATEREQCFVEAVDAWWNDNPKRALKLQREMARRWPRDLVAAKWGQYFCFNLGDADGMLDIARDILPHHIDVPQAHGMHAFGLEQCHRLDDAEAAGRRAVDMQTAEPWAHHAVAHVMETQGRVEEGIRWLTDHAETWEDRSIFIRGHNWWHLAVFHTDAEEYDAALNIFDSRLWGVWPEFSQEQIGAISMLWRLEMRGVDVGDRWSPIAKKVMERELEHVQPFLDLHYIFAIARAGRQDHVDEFLASMEAHSARRDDYWRPVWTDVALPAARAIADYAADRNERAYTQMKDVMPRLQAIGGSHAQRDVFVQTWIDVLLQTQRDQEAAPLLKERAQARPGVPVLQRLTNAVSVALQKDTMTPATA